MPPGLILQGVKRITCHVAAAGVAAALLLAPTVGAALPPADARPSPAAPLILGAPADVLTQLQVEVIDPDDRLSPGDVDLLTEQTPTVDLPPQVEQVSYLIFGDNENNLNDTMLDFARTQRPDLVSADGDKWAPGHLLVAVGLDPSRMGVYCGDDVCAAIDLYGEGRLDGVLDEMRPPLQQENWAAGLLRGTQAAADPQVRREETTIPGVVWAALGGGLVVLGGGVAAGVTVSMRRKKAATAREQFEELQRDYGRVGNQLTAIDVRAHSLSSPLANDRLRGDWEEVKRGFLGLHKTMDQLEGLSRDSADKEFLALAGPIGQAHEKVVRMRTAEENIEELADLEHGDVETRRRHLTELHEDVLAAELEVRDRDLGARLRAVDERVLELRGRLDDTRFMDDYADLIGDYRLIVEAVKQRMYEKSGTTAESHEAPRVWEESWRPGYGYGNYVPFLMISSWHSSDVAAAQAAASSSANTSYSAGGFSGGGGSSSF